MRLFETFMTIYDANGHLYGFRPFSHEGFMSFMSSKVSVWSVPFTDMRQGPITIKHETDTQLSRIDTSHDCLNANGVYCSLWGYSHEFYGVYDTNGMGMVVWVYAKANWQQLAQTEWVFA